MLFEGMSYGKILREDKFSSNNKIEGFTKGKRSCLYEKDTYNWRNNI